LEQVLSGARVVSGIIARSLSEVDDSVTLPQLRVLVLTSDRGALNLSDVAQLLEVHPSNATRLVDRLVKADLLDRRDDPDDRRQLRLTLTTGGHRIVKQVLEHRRRAFRDLLATLPTAAQVSVGTAMGRLAAAAPALPDAQTWVVPVRQRGM
jgi:DNA-binding MarR family transcriptional regulator